MSGETPQKIFRCDFSRRYGRCLKGCDKEFRWTTECPTCRGEVSGNCNICKGSGHINYTECPRHLAIKYERLLPYFYVWRSSDYQKWPDGKPMIQQPLKLRSAFNLLLWWYQRKEERDREKQRK